jgi:hypothetical protein
VRLQPFLPGIVRGGAARLGRALERAQQRPLPLEVVDRLERLLGRHLPPEVALVFECPGCGLLARGRARGRRGAAGRGIDMAARLERLIPRVPVRHWVLSLPRFIRVRLGEDEGLASSIARAFARTIASWQREKARALDWKEVRTGAVTVVQRAGTALNLDVHVHAMALDGVYELCGDAPPVFHPLPEPDAADLSFISMRVRRHVAARLRREGERPPSLAPLHEASVHHRIATGPRVGEVVPRRVEPEPPPPLFPAGKTHQSAGFSIHAAPPVAGSERVGLARLARYLTRPPIDPSALSPAPDGKIRYRLKQPFEDGTTHVEFAPHELVEKLLAIVPSGPSQRVAYHGVLAPAAGERCRIVPGQLELLPREPRAPRPAPARRVVIAPDAAPRCPDCNEQLSLVEVEHATDWLIGA